MHSSDHALLVFWQINALSVGVFPLICMYM